MTQTMHSRYLARAALSCALGLTACAPPRGTLPPSETFLQVGVDPALEATALERGLASDGFERTHRVEGVGWVAFAVHRQDGATAARLVTRHGVVVALDESPRLLSHTRGMLDVEDSPPSGTDVDGDGTLDVVLVRVEADRRCLLIVHLGEDGAAAPLTLDDADLEEDACLEAFRDVDGNSAPEAIVRLRARDLARASTPTVDLPLERDEAGIYHRVEPAARFLADERRERERRLLVARGAPSPEDVYTLALELALLVHISGETAEREVEAFDAAVVGVVVTEDVALAIREARRRIADGTAYD